MSKYNNKNTLLKWRIPFLDFLKVDERLNERLRRRWSLIEDFLKALKDLLIKVEQ